MVLGLFLFLIAMNVVSLAAMLARPGAPDPAGLAILAARTLLFLVLLFLYRRGWDPARHLFALFVTVFSAQALAGGITASRMPLGLVVPILVAALVSDWRGILASGLLLLGFIGWTAGLPALIQAPETLLVFFAALVLVLLIWIVLDNARRDAEAAAEELGHNLPKLEFSSIVLDKVGQSIIAGDFENRISYANERAMRLHGWSAGAVAGMTVPEGLVDRTEAQYAESVAAVKAGRTWSSETIAHDKDGRAFPVLLTLSPVRTSGGEIDGWVSVSVDLSELKAAEAALEELKATQSRLVLTEKLAALGQLVAGIAHQLNTPLGAMASSASVMGKELSKGFLPFLRDYAALGPRERVLAEDLFATASRIGSLIDPGEERLRRHAIARVLAEAGVEDADTLAADLAPILDEDGTRRMLPLVGLPEGRRLLDSIQSVTTAMGAGSIIASAVEKASRLVRTLKLYSGQGSEGEVPARMDLRSELRSLLAIYDARYGPGIDVAFSSDGDCEALGRRGELVQVFVNLLDNACQAMGRHGLLSVAVVRRGDRVLVSVADSGHGIDEAIRPRIFEPFFTTRKAGEGTGLGLDIARRIVERHGGGISFESEPGHTVFTVDLPGA
jgi:PAS domain S-box-containing protein